MTKFSQYLSPDLIAFLDVTNRDEALKKLVDLAAVNGKLHDKTEFYQAILEREKIVSTGIGMGIAIPHAKMAGYEDFFIVIGILQKGVDWNAMDGSPVRLIFLIAGPDDKQTQYLQLLSALTVAIKDEEKRKALLLEKSPEKIVELFKAY
ncbi:MAG: PTS sugar transporter subunit IIA [Parachlamydiales bacterium]|jgi:PTS system nitrogen regulatory IIA component